MFRKAKRIMGIVLLASFLFTFSFLSYIKIADVTPSFFGFGLQRIQSDSMEPALSVGEIILVKSVDPAKLEKGDVISYKGEAGNVKGKIITHQISKEPYEKDGVYYFTTRGIKVGVVDDPEISEHQIIGEVLYRIPLIGTIYDFFTTWYGMVAFVALLIIAFGSDFVALFTAIREKNQADFDQNNDNVNDVKQSEEIEVARELEFEGIITDLDDPDL